MEAMEHERAAGISWHPAGQEHFTGDVWIAPLGQMPDAAGLTILGVEFAPGARTGWHRHPAGQILYVVSGSGIVADEEGGRVVVGSGDVVRTAPGAVHWHGARADAPMMHLSLTTGGATEWTGRLVTDAEYEG